MANLKSEIKNLKCFWPRSSTGYPPERAVRYGRGISDFDSFEYYKSIYGRVVQLDRISDFGSEGWGFEPLRGHKRNQFGCAFFIR
jgi:hypothetical protein